MPAPFPTAAGSFPLSGQGTLSVTNASALISTMTLAPNSSGLPSTPTLITVKSALASSGVAFLSPFGGTAAAATGWPIEKGTSYSFNLARPDLATIISDSTATVTFEW